MALVRGLVLGSDGNPAAGRIVRAYRRDTGALLGSYTTSDGVGDYVDPLFSNVSLLLHGEGADASTTFTDNSLNGFTPTVGGSAQIKTDQFKFGSASMRFSGSPSKISYADNAAFELGSGDFTIEMFVRFSALPTGAARLFWKLDGTLNQRSYALYQFNNGGTQSLYFAYSTNGIAATDIIVPYTPATGTWLHYACTRSGSIFRFFVNGTQVGANQSISGTLLNGASAVEIGDNLNGWLDEIRLTKGVARYTSNFTAPAAAYPHGELTTGEYLIDCGSYTDEVNIICLDDAGGTLENDRVLRTYAV